MEADPEAVPAGCELIYAFLRERGREEEAERYRKRLFEHFDAAELAQEERSQYRDGDELLPHELTAEQVEGLRTQLRRFDRIENAYLARKRVEHFADKPLYVLAVETEARWYRSGTDEADAELLHTLSQRMEMPGESFFVILNNNFRKTKKTLRTMDNALIYGG
jgi:hypothetical protein